MLDVVEKARKTEYAPGPVGGPFAWKSADLLKDERWVHRLSDDDIVEIEAAVEVSRERGLDIIDITKDDFPLAGLAEKIDSMRKDILANIGFAYLRGLPVQKYDRETLTRIYWGLALHVGDPVAQNRNGHLLGHVIDIGTSVNDVNKRLTQTSTELQFHSDACDVVGLVCINTAMEGGQSALVSAAAVHDEMLRRRPALCHALYDPLTVDRRGEIPAGKQPWMRIPVFSWHKNSLVGYAPLKNYVESATRFDDAAKTTEEQWEAFRLFLDICNDPEFSMHIPFEPGDFQFVHNHVVFHSRTSFKDWPDAPERKRHLMRIWLSLPDGLDLPESIAERWINIELGTKRGGVNIPNRKNLTIALEPETPAFD
jgi:hypothetical protein